MTEVLATLAQLSVLVFVIGSMFSLGLSLTMKQIIDPLRNARMVVWNGPMGVFEFDAFAEGTMSVAKTLADSKARSIVGGGDSVAAVMKAGVESKMTHISTGGGASLEFLEGKTLPGIAALTDAKN